MKGAQNRPNLSLSLVALTMILGISSACDSGKKKNKTPAASSNATGTKDTTNPQSPNINPACLTADEALKTNGKNDGAGALQNPTDPNDEDNSADPAGPAAPNPPLGQSPTQCAPANPATPPSPTDPAAPPTPSPDNSGGTPATGDIAPWTPGPGLTGCAEQGKVWIAVNKGTSGKSGICGESLASFCCTQSGVLEKFPSYKSKLEPEFTKFSGEGLILYGCSTDGVGKTTLHFSRVTQNTIYKSIWLGEKTAPGQPPASCPKVTLEDLGYKPATTPSSPSGTGAATSTGTGAGASTSTGTGASTSTSTSTGTGT